MTSLDFITLVTRKKSKDVYEVEPSVKIKRSKDLIVKGGDWNACWDSEANMWTTDWYRFIDIVDGIVSDYIPPSDNPGVTITKKYFSDANNGTAKKAIEAFKMFPKIDHALDREVTFKSEEVTKRDYRSRRLPYDPEDIPTPWYDKLMSTIWTDEDRQMVEWCMGAILTGEAKNIQKFLVMYGDPGSGKSTTIKIFRKLLECEDGSEYAAPFTAEGIVKGQTHATECLVTNPLLLFQDDANLSVVFDNTVFNSMVSHEEITINPKYVKTYSQKLDSFIVLGTNSPVAINSTKAGMIRRLLDVKPTGKVLSDKNFREGRKHWLAEEIPGIAYRCMSVFENLGPSFYDDYRSSYMIEHTNVIHEFMLSYISDTDGLEDWQINCVPAMEVFKRYNKYCEITNHTALPYNKFRTEAEVYWDRCVARIRCGPDNGPFSNKQARNVFVDFKYDKLYLSDLKGTIAEKEKNETWLDFKSQTSVFDLEAATYPAQYANDEGTPRYKWENVKTKLQDIDTDKLHYVQVPNNHIIIDFDIPNVKGDKDLALNKREAEHWPETYAELSKSGQGIHLHYIYDGDPLELADHFDDKIEIKVYKGNSSLRRLLSLCNASPIAHLSDGSLPKKEKKFSYNKGCENEFMNMEEAKVDRYIRSVIANAFKKKHHGATKPEVDYIKFILDQAYESGKTYDVSDMYSDIVAFAGSSTHQADKCLEAVKDMHFKSAEIIFDNPTFNSDKIVFYDVEVFPNLLLINWKYQGKDEPMHRMINPTPDEVAKLCEQKLVGFNVRKYDNHIIFARAFEGYTSAMEIFKLSDRIINDSTFHGFGPAWGLSYGDIYEIATKKQSLKKWEIELGIHHEELGLPWDQPVPEDQWDKVAHYCDNDVYATEAVWDYISDDITAHEILVELANLFYPDRKRPFVFNDTTRHLAEAIIFHGDEIVPDRDLKYTNLAETFPGYKFETVTTKKKNGNTEFKTQSTYKNKEINEGGRVVADHGIWYNVVTADVESMHPSSLEQLNLFGDYTKNFSELKATRLDIKHKDLEKAATRFNGVLKPFLKSEKQAKALAKAFKLVINSMYGYTQLKIDSNPFWDPRNVDNIVAKRGALFMVDLQELVEREGYHVAHIKTDSIKVTNSDDYILKRIVDFGKTYGYRFEVESRYDKMCLVNDSTYIAYGSEDGEPKCWHATGAQFKHPYVFKKWFSHEEITLDDMSETKEVKAPYEMFIKRGEELEYIGKVGRFLPVQPGTIGGQLVKTKDHVKYDAVTGTKGYEWVEAEKVTPELEHYICYDYHEKLAQKAREAIEEYGDFDEFCVI